jgi:hypothetical protein
MRSISSSPAPDRSVVESVHSARGSVQKKKEKHVQSKRSSSQQPNNPVQQRHSVERLERNRPRGDRGAAVESAGEG